MFGESEFAGGPFADGVFDGGGTSRVIQLLANRSGHALQASAVDASLQAARSTFSLRANRAATNADASVSALDFEAGGED